MNYKKFTDTIFNNGEYVKFFCSSFADWKQKEKEIIKEFPNASCISMPGLGYAGEYWYKI